jgi:polysaccharide biosynthesis transport protein
MNLRPDERLLDSPPHPAGPPHRQAADDLGWTSGVQKFHLDEEDEESRSVNLRRYWNLAAKYKWLLASSLILGLVAGVVATLLTTPVYQSSATVQIDEEPAKVVAVESQRPTQPSSAEKFYQTQYELLKSRALAERVVAKENLADNERFLKQWDKKAALLPGQSASAPRTAAERRARTAKATELVSGQLRIEPVRLSRIVKISYESPDPYLAATIANAVAANYITWNLERRFEASSAARRFLEDRLDQTRQSLEEAQRRGNQYAQQNQLITIEGAGGEAGQAATGESLVAQDLANVNVQLAAATEARIKAEQRWRQASATPDLELPEVLSNGQIQTLQTNRAAANWEYQQNLRVYKPDWPAMLDARKKIEGLDQQFAAQVAAIRGAMRTELETARKNEAQFRGEVERRKQELLNAQSKRVEQSFINTDISTSKSLYDGMLASYKQIGLAGGIGDNNISFVDKAERPQAAIKPQARNNLIQFGLLGLILGAMVAFLLDRLDLSIKAPTDVEADLHLPVLGVVPTLAKEGSPRQALADPKSHLSEAYYSVRTALQFSTENGLPSSLLVSSSRPAEGKSTSALAIAVGFARLGHSVLLIDADMRDPSMHKTLGGDNGVGLSNLLAGGADLAPALQVTDYENLAFLACGPLPPNPAELLGGANMRRLLASARSHFDLVVIDGPPVMGLADSPQLANIVAGVVFVVSSGQIKRDIAKAAVRRLRVPNVRILGAILTKFDARKAGLEHDYGYGYEYGSKPDNKRRFGGFGKAPKARRA